MRRMFINSMLILMVQLLAVPVFAQQQDKLVGRWEGKIQAPQGERPTNLTFKKEGDALVGTMPGMRPGTEMQIKDVKIDGNKITAKSEVEMPQGGSLTINYSFTLEGDQLNGQGSADLGGQSITFDISLKRATGAAPSASASDQAQGGQRQRGPSVPQPQQKQSIDYFVGQWNYKYIGRESALGPAPRECSVTFAKRPDGKSVEGVTQCKHDGGAFKETSVIVFDEATKMMTVTEKLGSGVSLNSRADWTSPISIRYTIDPIKIKGQPLQLRRTISVVSAHSFTIAEELSEEGGPFVRLGNAVVTKAGSNQ